MGHYQMYKYWNNLCSRKRREGKGGRKFKEIIAQKFPTLERDLDIPDRSFLSPAIIYVPNVSLN